MISNSTLTAQEDNQQQNTEKGSILPYSGKPTMKSGVTKNSQAKGMGISLDGGTFTPFFAEDFEDVTEDWTLQTGWEIGSPSTGPELGYDSPNCAANSLHGHYVSNNSTRLISPVIDLPELPSAAHGIYLYFHEWFEIETGYDYGLVQVTTDGGLSWTTIDQRDGNSGWIENYADLSSFNGQSVQISFYLYSDYSYEYEGWYLDNIIIGIYEPEYLSASLKSLNPQNFPSVYLNVSVDTNNVGISTLDASNFRVYEDDLLQDEYFFVSPPEEGSESRSADIVFVLDVSGSMSAEISSVKQNMASFIQGLEDSDVNYGIGFVVFADDYYIYNNKNLYFNREDILSIISNIQIGENGLGNGGDYPENQAGSMAEAALMNYRPGSQRIQILLTDATSHENDSYTPWSIEGVLNERLIPQNITVFPIFDVTRSDQRTQYTQLADITSDGSYYHIYDNFNEIISKIQSSISSTYLLQYRTKKNTVDGTEREVRIDVTYKEHNTSVKGTYTPGTAPNIIRTAETVNLEDKSWSEHTDLLIEVIVNDEVEPYTQSVYLNYRNSFSISYSEIIMEYKGGNHWSAVVPAAAVTAPGIDYYITATDGTATTSLPYSDPGGSPFQIGILPNLKPQIHHIPLSEFVPGDILTITAEVTDNTNEVAKVNLYYKRVGDLNFNSIEMSNISESTYQYELTTGEADHVGLQYYIVGTDDFGVTGSSGSASSPHDIGNIYNHPPVVISEPSSSQVSLGNTIQLSVEADGRFLQYYWKKDGVLLEASAHYSGIGTNTLTIRDITLAEAGIYSCYVDNWFGSVETAKAIVMVTDFWDSHLSGGIAVQIIETAGTKLVKYISPGSNGEKIPVVNHHAFIDDFDYIFSLTDINSVEELILYDENKDQIGHIPYRYYPEQESGYMRHALLILHNSSEDIKNKKGEILFPYSKESGHKNWDYFKIGEYPVTMLLPPDDIVSGNSMGNRLAIDFNKDPVLFVHGWNGNYGLYLGKDEDDKDAVLMQKAANNETSNWWMTVKLFNDNENYQGWQIYYPYDSWIEMIGKWLAYSAEYLYGIYQKPLNIVNHSMGNLSSLEMITNYGPNAKNRFNKVFCSTPPLHGSLGANKHYETILGFFVELKTGMDSEAPCVIDMSFGSDFLYNLHEVKKWYSLDEDDDLFDDYFVLAGSTPKHFRESGYLLDLLHNEAAAQSDGIVAISSASALDHGIGMATFHGNHDDGRGCWSNLARDPDLQLTKYDRFLTDLLLDFFNSDIETFNSNLTNNQKIRSVFDHEANEIKNTYKPDDNVDFEKGVLNTRFTNFPADHESVFGNQYDFKLSLIESKNLLLLEQIHQLRTYDFESHDFIRASRGIMYYFSPTLFDILSPVDIGFMNKNKTVTEDLSYFFSKEALMEDCVTNLPKGEYNLSLLTKDLIHLNFGVINFDHLQTEIFNLDNEDLVNPFAFIDGKLSPIAGADLGKGTLTKGSEVLAMDTSTVVDIGADYVIFQLIAPDAYYNEVPINFVVKDPDGIIVNTDAANVSWGKDDLFGYEYFAITNPVPGTWDLKVFTDGSAIDTMIIQIFIRSDVKASFMTESDIHIVGKPVSAYIALNTPNSYLIDSSMVKAEVIISEDSSFTRIQKDLMVINDTLAVLPLDFTVDSIGAYMVNVEINGSYNSSPFNRVLSKQFIFHDSLPQFILPDIELSVYNSRRILDLKDHFYSEIYEIEDAEFTIQQVDKGMDNSSYTLKYDTVNMTLELNYLGPESGEFVLQYEITDGLNYSIGDTIKVRMKAPRLALEDYNSKLCDTSYVIHMGVENLGEVYAVPNQISIYLSEDAILDETDSLINRISFSYLEQSETLLVHDTLHLNPTLLDSNYYMLGLIDTGSEIDSAKFVRKDIINLHIPVMIEGEVSACAGETLELIATEGLTEYEWNTGESNTTITISESGKYLVGATDLCNIRTKDSLDVIFHNLPQPNLGEDLEIAGYDTIKLEVSEPYLSYLWSTGEYTPSIFVEDLTTGEHSYVLQVTDENGCSGSDTIMVSVVSTGVDAHTSYNLKLYPVPANEVLYISVNMQISEDIELVITDLSGRERYCQSLPGIEAGAPITCDLDGLEAGVYVLTFQHEQQKIHYRFVKL
jgi:hypothetical protein